MITTNSAEEPALEELRNSYAQGEIVLFVGAGVSVAAGLPSWTALVRTLVDRACQCGMSPIELQEIEDFMAKRKFIDALSAVRESLGPQEFGVAVERCLDDRDLPIPDVITAIALLAPRLRAVLTTNLDRLLERGLGADWEATARPTADIAQRRKLILKLHGTLTDHSTWVLTREAYDHVMYADHKFQGVFSSLFFSRTLLFIGYGLADDDFDQLLGRVRALSGQQAPRHFALVASEEITPYRRRHLQASGIQIISYPNPDGRHSALASILRSVASAGAPSETKQQNPRVLDLLIRVQARTEPLSILLAEALSIATGLGDHELQSFCKVELGGYVSTTIAHKRTDSHFPIHRNVDGYLSLSEIEPDYIGWNGDLSRALDYMANKSDEFIKITMFFPVPMLELERKANESHRRKLLRASGPASDFSPGMPPETRAHFYAPGDALFDVTEKVRALLTRRLIAILGR
ncbi:SIR2 family NAD-dependent protein deacylase [Sorangium sp. So ce385]|uniref:SIR2 family NAD-dependent protein deacylase n=1 Tax=Sorangium sp. So ce385 TaxID=3133308 RepID=UPI003F5B8A50